MARLSWLLSYRLRRQKANPEVPKRAETILVSTSYATATMRQNRPETFNSEHYYSEHRTSLEGSKKIDRTPSVHTLEDGVRDLNRVEKLIIHIIKKDQDDALEQVQKQLDAYGSDVPVTTALMDAAVGNWRKGNTLAHLLLCHVLNEQNASPPPSLDSGALLKALQYGRLTNETDLEPVVKLGYWGPYSTPLLRKLIHNIIHKSPKALRILEMMLRLRPVTKYIPEGLVVAAVENRTYGAHLIALLLRETQHGDPIPITDEVLWTAAGNGAANKQIFEIIFQERQDSLQITPRLLKEVMVNNDERAEAIVNLLLAADLPENRALIITESVAGLFKPLTIGGKISGDISDNRARISCLRAIMEKLPDTLQFTGLALDAMASLEDARLLEEFFSQTAVSSRFKIPEHMVEAATSNRRAGTEVMEALLRHRGEEITITERVLVAAAANDGCGLEILEMLLREREGEIRVTERILEAVVNMELVTDRSFARHEGLVGEEDPWYKERDKLKLRLLLGHTGCRSRSLGLTSTIIRNSVWADDMVREVLLSKFDRHSILVTADILEQENVLDQLLTGVQNIHLCRSALSQIESAAHPDVLAVLLHRTGLKVDGLLQESALIAAITNRDHGTAIIDLVLAHPWKEVTITERVVSIGWATQSLKGYLETFLENLLAPTRAASVNFSPEAVKTMMQHCHPSIIRLWLQTERSTKDQITPNMMESLAKNTEFGGDILIILLRDRPDKIVITNSVLHAAFNSTYSPHNRRFLHILLSERADIPLSSALMKATAFCYDRTLWHWMLWESGRDSDVTEEVVITVMGNPYYADSMMMDLLLRKDGNGGGIHITERILEAVIRNEELGLDILKLLLKERSGDIRVTERVLEAAVCNIDILRTVLELQERGDERGEESGVSERVLEAALRRNSNDAVMPVLRLLLEKRGGEIIITERILEVVVEKAARDAVIPVLELLFEQRGDELAITERVLEAAVASPSAVLILELFLEERPNEVVITERVLEAAVGNEWLEVAPKVIELLIDEYGDEIQVSEAVIVAACRNRWYGRKTMEIIFGGLTRSEQYAITEKILETAVRNDAGIVELLLARPGNHIHMTTAVLEAALESGQEHVRALHLLLRQGKTAGSQVYLTESVLQKCVSKGQNTLISTGVDIVQQFVQSSPQEIRITEGLVTLMARACLELLLELYEERGHEIDISQTVLEAAVAGGHFHLLGYNRGRSPSPRLAHAFDDQVDWVAHLLHLGEGTCQVNDRVVEVAAMNPEYGYGIVKLLLEEYGGQFRVNERILKAAIRNDGSRDLKLLDLLLRERGGEIYITESLVEAAAGIRRRGKEMVDLLLQHSGDRMRLTDGIAEAAAGNEECGEQILELFRVRGERP